LYKELEQYQVYIGWIVGMVTASFAPVLASALKRYCSTSEVSVSILRVCRVKNNGWEVRVAFKNTGSREDTFVTAHLLLDRSNRRNIGSFSKLYDENLSDIDPWAFNNPLLIPKQSIIVQNLFFLEGVSNTPELLEFSFHSGKTISINIAEASQEFAMFQSGGIEKWTRHIQASLDSGDGLLKPIWRN
jgi:hypothetical protein